MKSLVLLSVMFVVSFGLSAQSALSYSLARPNGGDLTLLEINLSLGTETIIDSYSSSELDDYDPGATSFDHENKKFVTLGSNLGINEGIVVLNVTNGNIDYFHASSSYEFFSVEALSDNVYSLARPIGGGDLVLLQTDLSSGTETVIYTYPSSELNDYNPETTSLNEAGLFVTLEYDLSGNTHLIALDITDGHKAYSYTSSTYEFFSVEYFDGIVYSLARPIGGGDLTLLKIDLSLSTETMIDSYPSSELDDYDPGATSYDQSVNGFVTIGSDLGGVESIISMHTMNGDIDFSLTSTVYDHFSVESDGNLIVGLNEVANSEDWITIYPNPSQNEITIKSNKKIEQLEIVDALGRTIHLSYKNPVLDVTHLPSGIYWIRLTDKTDTFTKQFIKN